MPVAVGLSDPVGLDGAYDKNYLVNGLWQEAPFTRLPSNAPPELQDYVQEIRNPKRSYAVHRASRRHDFQALVARFMIQLRRGCGDCDCDVSSCFTCRLRLAGTKPIRRYSPTSARILAVYMAGCQNPYDQLCPGLRTDRGERSSRMPQHKRHESMPCLTVKVARLSTNPLPDRNNSRHPPNKIRVQLHPKPASRSTNNSPTIQDDREDHPTVAEDTATYLAISDQPANKDHRSFAAATFETLAFKMVQWLTPSGIHTLSEAMTKLVPGGVDPAFNYENHHSTSDGTGSATSNTNSPRPVTTTKRLETTQHPFADRPETTGSSFPAQRGRTTKPGDGVFTSDGSYPSVKTERRRSTGSVILSTNLEDGRRSMSRHFDSADDSEGSQDTRPAAIAEEAVSLDVSRGRPFMDSSPPPPILTRVLRKRNISVGLRSAPGHPSPGCREEPDVSEADNTEADHGRPVPRPNLPRPQTLSHLSPAVVDFMCDIYSEDCTAERPRMFTSDSKDYGPVRQSEVSRLVRLGTDQPHKYASIWKAFNDQSIFSVLSDPRALISSFTRNGKLLDSQTLWYCMVRLTRAMPDLVFHSLWLAADELLVAPKDLSPVPSGDPVSSPSRPLSNIETGYLMSICLHALVAAVPVVSDSRTLYEMSRIRAGGQALATTASGVNHTHALCLEYDDVFSSGLALRLARRLFLALPARQRYADLQRRRTHSSTRRDGHVLLDPLFAQLDFMNNETVSLMEFSPADRLLHETRVPTLLLDWARAVLMTSWDGQPYFPVDNAFGGAMSFIGAMHRRRNSLLLGDVQFRIDFFSERLDSVEVPVKWATPKAMSGVGHIMDYPFLFTSEALVSFFRSMNFARMSKTYEESSSLQTRMTAIVQPGSLITNPHHKFVLQDLLKTASAKYLILDIGRSNVLRDAFDQLWRREQRELLRPLKVHLGEDAGEEGFDSGGVQQEFFRMAISECLDPKYGAFSVDERTRMAWFMPGSIVEPWRFELVGVLISLALYNGLTLPVTFPRALYRKLLGSAVSELHHIADGWPELVSGLTTLLEWDESNGLVEDVFARTYDFSVAAFGKHVSRKMNRTDEVWPSSISTDAEQELATSDAESPLVTNANRDEYVSDYIRYLTDVSVRSQFKAFERGFRRCLCSRSLKILSPAILQSLVEGVQDIDIAELRRNARYVGWDSSHRTVKEFWSVVKKYDLDMRRRLLEFVTASDRVPVGGMRNMQFVIQKNGEEDGEKGRLPTAYTCYGTLLLPEYTDKDILKERLGMALENAQGFGFA